MARKRTKKNSRGRFILSLLTYVLIFLAVVGIGLRFLWSFLNEYELSRPEHTMDSFLASLSGEHLRDIAEENYAAADSNIQSSEACYEYVRSLFSGELKYKRDRSLGDSDNMAYAIFNGDELLGKVVITRQPRGDFGLTRWEVTQESFDFSSHLSSFEISVPDTYTVFCNGVELGEKYVTATADFELLSDYMHRLEGAPRLVTYSTGDCFGEQELYAVSPDGVRLTLEDITDEYVFTDNLTAAEMAEMKPFVDEYVERYVCYASGANEAYRYNLQMLQEYLVLGSDFERRLDSSVISMIHSHSKEDVVLRKEINHCMNVNDDYYVCDVSYDVRTLGNEGYYQSTSNIRLLIAKTETGLLVDAMTGY